MTSPPLQNKSPLRSACARNTEQCRRPSPRADMAPRGEHDGRQQQQDDEAGFTPVERRGNHDSVAGMVFLCTCVPRARLRLW